MVPDVIKPVHAGNGLPVTRMDPKEKFYRHFQEAVIVLQDQISQLGSVAKVGGERQDAIDHVLAGISLLSNEVSDASDYVPAYDQRTYSQAIKALTEKLNATTTKLAPRSRFQFKPRSQETSTSQTVAPKNDPRLMVGGDLKNSDPVGLIGEGQRAVSEVETDKVGDLPSFPKNYNEEMAQPGANRVRKPSFSAARDIAISGQNGLHIILPSTASRATSAGSLTDLSGCIVDMSIPTAGSAPFAGLALKNISKCLIIAGQVAGPAHMTNISDSIVVVAARQVRIHECRNVDIYLHCTSHPIIEDCSNMRFAPLPACYMKEAQDTDQNQWDQVDDFKWLKSDHSPNWSVLPEQERIVEDIWTKVVPGEPGVGIDGILGAVGLSGR